MGCHRAGPEGGRGGNAFRNDSSRARASSFRPSLDRQANWKTASPRGEDNRPNHSAADLGSGSVTALALGLAASARSYRRHASA